MTDQPENQHSQIGMLHPGQMGSSIAAALVRVGHTVYWASQNRSSATIERASQAALDDIGNVQTMCSTCRYVFTICPPDQASAVARQVADAGFAGIYIDCNAVSPTSSKAVAGIVATSGATYVDGGIIGPPATKKGSTRLYLSGAAAVEVAGLFEESLVDARSLGSDAGSASALKMAYAGWTKGSAALLITQFALAQEQQVESALLEEWALSQPGLSEQLHDACRSMAPKAWRFKGEMDEIARTLEDAGLPRSWFEGAADTYERLSDFKNHKDVDPSAVINALINDRD